MISFHRHISAVLTLTAFAAVAHAGSPSHHAKPKAAAKHPAPAVAKQPKATLSDFTLLPMSQPSRTLPAGMEASSQVPSAPSR